MLKGDLVKREDIWFMVYSEENDGRIREIELNDYSKELLYEMKGGTIKFVPNVHFYIVDNLANIRFFEPDSITPHEPTTKSSTSCLEIELENNLDNRCIIGRNPFSKEEEKIMDHIIEAHNEFSNLEQTHPSDVNDWVFHLHGLQKILGQRILRRDYPIIFPIKK